MEESKFLEKYKIAIVKQNIKILLSKIEIDYTEQELFEMLMNIQTKKRCIGVTSSLKQCTSNAFENLNYCKKHMFNYGLIKNKEQNKEQNDTKVIFVSENNIIENLPDKQLLKKKFIDDTFYFIDDSYIYDIKTMKKVGINSKEEFFLSCDPFILGQM